MKRRILIGVFLATMVVSLAGCGNKADSASTYFKALENTIKADNYQVDISIYEADVSREYLSQMSRCKDGDKVYCGYANDLDYNSDYFDYTYDTGTFYRGDEQFDMTEEDNKYSEDNLETDRYKIYKLLKTLGDGDIDGVMENISVFESAELTPSYRVYKQGIIEVTDKYLKDKNSVSFIKDLSMENNEMKLTMYAADFYFWCDDNIDSYKMSSEMKEELGNTAYSKVLLVVDIKLDGKFVSDYQFYHILSGEEDKDGIAFKFEDINKSVDDCILALYFKDRDKYNQMRDEALNKTLIKAVKEISAENPDYRYKIGDDKTSLFYYRENGGVGDYRVGVYGYGGLSATGDKEHKNYVRAYTPEEILGYLEDGTELPEKTLSWQDIYIDYLDTYDKGAYDLVDLTSDGIPELLSHTNGGYYNELSVFTIDNERVVEIECENRLYGNLKIFEETGIIASTFKGDVTVTDYYKIDNSNIIKLTYLTYDFTQGVPVYLIDNKEVSEEQYNSKKKELEGSSKGITEADAKSAEDLIKEISSMK